MSKSKDQRMLVARAIEDFEKEPREFDSVEYEVLCDSDIAGAVDYGPCHFTVWEIGFKDFGQPRLLCLRLQNRRETRTVEQIADEARSASKTGFYHGVGLPGELTALASLFLRRRLRLGRMVRMNNEPRMFAPLRRFIDLQLVEGQSNLGELSDWLNRTSGLRMELQRKFILAARLYQQALDLIEEKADLAYLNLVSAIEVLAQDFKITAGSLQEIDPVLAGLVDKVQDAQLRSDIQSRVLARERFIKRRFVNFIVQHVDRSFWEDSRRPQRGRIEPTQLSQLLERIYNQRSATLHRGEPFPPNIFGLPMIGAELDFGDLMIGDRKWEEKDFIPHPSFFERLVNHVLKNFLLQNQISTGAAETR